MSQTSRSVLVLDDDRFFRQTVAALLAPRGYEILEARNGREAHEIMAKTRPVLVMVDYRLPDIDGIHWIQQLRERGNNLPIVFITAHFCDAQTFNWLRNILKVSLVLSKPISDELFLQQLEGVLPMVALPSEVESAKVEAPTEDAASQIKEEYDRLLKKFPDSREYIDAAVEAMANEAEGRSETELVEQLRQVGRKLQVQNALSAAKISYARNLTDEWQKLSAAVATFQSDSENGIHREEAVGIAHQLRGTAGSLGFIKVSEAAGRIESFLKAIDVTDDTHTELIWTEVFRALTDGELAVRSTSVKGDGEQKTPRLLISGKLLALTEDEEMIGKLMLVQGRLPIEVVITETAQSTLVRASTTTFDLIVLDLRLPEAKDCLHLCRELRKTTGHENVPFAFLPDPDDALPTSALNYVGCSAVLDPGRADDHFLRQIGELMSVTQAGKPRVLAVDDDQVLSSFIASVLSPQGLVVQTLKEPIHILEKMAEFKPELVILDVMMPGLSGYDVCRLLRSREEWQKVSVLFLTSKSTAEGRAAAFRAGADDFLSKPVLTEELIARVTTQIERARATRRATEKDELTGCLQRKYFVRTLQETFTQGNERQGCLVLIEIDRFDSLENAQGIFVMDDVLVAAGKLLRRRLQSQVMRGRWGDKTLIVYLPGESAQQASQIIQSFQSELESFAFNGGSGRFQVTLSAGQAQYPQEAASARELIELAHRRLNSTIQEKTHARIS
jgi:diguanylate cyclase (GGDEF)-like protein